MSEVSGGRLVAQQLKLAGIDTAFGVLAGPMIDVLAGMNAEGIKVVNCRHEQAASFMASAWGYITGKPGVIVAGGGPGMINTVTSMYVATESATPLVVLGGSFHGNSAGLGGFQEADQLAFARPACKWVAQVTSTERIPEFVYLALGKAVSGRPGAVYLDFPGDLVSKKVPVDSVRRRPQLPEVTAPHPSPAAVEQVATMLRDAKRPLIMVGKGAAWAGADAALTELAALGIPFVASPMGRGTIADDHPFAANAARSTALAEADVILTVGARFNWIFQFGHAPRYRPDVRIAHIDVEAEEMYSGANVEVGIVADCRVAVEQLLEALRGSRFATEDWQALLAEKGHANEERLTAQAYSDATPINHFRLVREVRDALPRDVQVSVDAEITMAVARIMLRSYGPRRLLNSGTTGCMGTGVPYAIGAKLARPEVPSIALVGDYAFGTSMAEVETAARVNAPVVFVVSNNAGIAGHAIQRAAFPPDAPLIAGMLPANYEKAAELVGGFSRRVEHPSEIAGALRDAIAANTVAVVNVLTDPDGAGVGHMYLG